MDGIDLALAIGTVLLVAAAGSWSLGERRKDRAYLVRWVLLAVCGGMVAYCLYALLLFRPELWGQQLAGEPISRAAMLGIVVVGTLLPLVIRRFLSRAHGS